MAGKPTGNPNGRPLKFKTADELGAAIDSYFAEIEYDYTETLDDGSVVKRKGFTEHPTITGLAVYLKCDRDTLLNYEDKDPDFFGTIKAAKLKIHKYAEQQLFRQQGNVTGIIFNLKNNFQWVDQQLVDQKISGSLDTSPVEKLPNDKELLNALKGKK
jgi:hypothetical protein